jgi:hypothetical protein
VFSYQSGEDLFNRADFDSKEQRNQEQIKEASRSKRSLRGSEHIVK